MGYLDRDLVRKEVPRRSLLSYSEGNCYDVCNSRSSRSGKEMGGDVVGWGDREWTERAHVVRSEHLVTGWGMVWTFPMLVFQLPCSLEVFPKLKVGDKILVPPALIICGSGLFTPCKSEFPRLENGHFSRTSPCRVVYGGSVGRTDVMPFMGPVPPELGATAVIMPSSFHL